MSDEWLTVKEAATAAGVSERTVWRWVRAGRCVSRVSDSVTPPARLVRQGSWPGATDTPSDTCQTPVSDPTTAPAVSVAGADPALAAVLGALVQEVAHLRAAVERQDATIRELRALPAPNTDEPGLVDELRELRAVVAHQAEELAGLRPTLEAPVPAVEPLPKRRAWWRWW